ncbi:thioredoxin family protein [bacterium]|nr:thioredoxin family protein [bacterium]MDA7929294.1 thioredoxin family protein [Akkermansiaceae bacterium]MDB4423453.1 thioredoxin family protein [bacterium]
MKIAPIIASTLFACSSFTFAGGEGWMHDFEAAKKKAASENKDLFIDFTGSDWCGWCIKLNEEVFQHEPFKKGVADSFILVELDYPRDKSKLSKETIAQNEKLREEYQIQGYPTILLTDAEGRPYAKTGYQKGGPESYVKHLEELTENKKARDEAFKKASASKGLEKAMALNAGLQEVPEDFRRLYPGVVEDIIANDPEDKTGLKAAQAARDAKIELEKKLQAAMQSGKSSEALALIDTYIKEQKLEGAAKQEAMMYKLNILFGDQDFDALEKAIDEVIAVDPDSKTGKQMTSFKNTRLKQMKAQAEANKE